MNTMYILERIKITKALLLKAESESSLRLVRQYTVALYHLNECLYISIENEALKAA